MLGQSHRELQAAAQRGDVTAINRGIRRLTVSRSFQAFGDTGPLAEILGSDAFRRQCVTDGPGAARAFRAAARRALDAAAWKAVQAADAADPPPEGERGPLWRPHVECGACGRHLRALTVEPAGAGPDRRWWYLRRHRTPDGRPCPCDTSGAPVQGGSG